jgi:hypothetical protein
MYQKTIDEKIDHTFLTNYISCLYPELDEFKDCDDIEKHTKSSNLIICELLETFAYKTRDYYYLDDALLRKKNKNFQPNGFFSVMENCDFNNFLITRNLSHISDITFSNLMGGHYNEIVCGKITNQMYNNKYFNTNDAMCLKWNDIETSNIIDNFLEYEFNENTFGYFVTALFPESNDDIMIYFEILDNYASSITYKIKIPIEKYKYNKTIPICIDVSTGFYSI